GTSGYAEHDREKYKWRHLVENFFCSIKAFRRIATRYEKTDKCFAAIINLVAAVLPRKYLLRKVPKLSSRAVVLTADNNSQKKWVRRPISSKRTWRKRPISWPWSMRPCSASGVSIVSSTTPVSRDRCAASPSSIWRITTQR